MAVEDNTPIPAGPAPATLREDAYLAVHQAAGQFDRSPEGRLRLTGADRATWLQGLITNDVAALAPGRGCYAAYLTAQGRMITDLRVLALSDGLLLDVPAATIAPLHERFEMFIITEDVAVQDVTRTLDRIGLHGPLSAAVLARALAAPQAHDASARVEHSAGPGDLAPRLASLSEHDALELTWQRASADQDELAPAESVRIVVAGSRELGTSGFDLYVAVEAAPWLRVRLRQAGAVIGDEATRDVLRIEAGIPVFGRDMDETTIPLEAGIEARAISFTKGCYVGQEVIVRVMHRGHGRVARRLVGLVPRETQSAREGDLPVVVSAGDILQSGDGQREIGRVTSAAFSPTLGHVIALGYVQRDFVEAGTPVGARHDDRPVGLVVRELPFLR